MGWGRGADVSLMPYRFWRVGISGPRSLPGMGMSRGGYVQGGWVCQMVGIQPPRHGPGCTYPPLLLTPSDGHHVHGQHPTVMQSCLHLTSLNSPHLADYCGYYA